VELLKQRREVTDAVQRRRGIIVHAVFHRDGEPIHYFRRSWISACIAAGLGEEVTDEAGNVVDRRAFRIVHDYRRSAARNLSRAGVPEAVIMAVCGWRTRSVFDRYNIVNEADITAGLARLAASPQGVKRSKFARIAKAK